MYPSSEDRMAVMWPRMYVRLLERLLTLKIQDKHVAKMAKILENDVDNPKPIGKNKYIILLIARVPYSVNIVSQLFLHSKLLHFCAVKVSSHHVYLYVVKFVSNLQFVECLATFTCDCSGNWLVEPLHQIQ